jgi:hypothetical protein
MTIEELNGFVGCLRRQNENLQIFRSNLKEFCALMDYSSEAVISFVFIAVLGLVEKFCGRQLLNNDFFHAGSELNFTTLLNCLLDKRYRQYEFSRLAFDDFDVGLDLVLKHHIMHTSNLEWIKYVVKLGEYFTNTLNCCTIGNVKVCRDAILPENFEESYIKVATEVEWKEWNLKFISLVSERAPNVHSLAICLSHWICHDSILELGDSVKHYFIPVLQKYIQSLSSVLMVVKSLHAVRPHEGEEEFYGAHLEQRNKNNRFLVRILTEIFFRLIVNESISCEELKTLSVDDFDMFLINEKSLMLLFTQLWSKQTQSCLDYILLTDLISYINAPQSVFVQQICVKWLNMPKNTDRSSIVENVIEFMELLEKLSNAMDSARLKSKFLVEELAMVVAQLIQYFDQILLNAAFSSFHWVKCTVELAFVLFRDKGRFSSRELQMLISSHISKSIRSIFLGKNVDESDLEMVLDYLDVPVSTPDDDFFFKNAICCYIELLGKHLNKATISFSFLAPYHKLFQRLFVANGQISHQLALDSRLLVQNLNWLRSNIILPFNSGDMTVGEYEQIFKESNEIMITWTDILLNFAKCVDIEFPVEIFGKYLNLIGEFDQTYQNLGKFLTFVFTCLPKDSPFLKRLNQATDELEKIAKQRTQYSLMSLENGIWHDMLCGLILHANEYSKKASSKVFTSMLKHNFLQQHNLRGN